MYDFALLTSSCFAASDGSRSRQCNGERVAGEHHQGNEPPDGALTVSVGADQLGHVADRRRLRLDSAALRGQGGAFRLEGGQSTRLPVSLLHKAGAGPALSFHRGQSGVGLAPLGGFLEGADDLSA